MFGTQQEINALEYNYYGNRMATCSTDQYVKVWDKTEKCQWTLTSSWKTFSESIEKVTWAHPDHGQVLATCSFDRKVAVWEEIVKDVPGSGESGTKHWVCRMNLVDPTTSITDVKFGPKSQSFQLATCSLEGIIRIYEALDVTNLSRWTLQHEIQCKLSLSCLDWNPDSRLHPLMIAVGSDETDVEVGGKIFIFEYSQNSKMWIELDTIKSLMEPVHDIAFAPNLERDFPVLAVAANNVRAIKLTLVEDEQSAQRVLKELDLPIATQIDDKGSTIKRVYWNISGTVLVSPEDDVAVRMFQSFPARAELCLLPRDENKACRQSFYHAIRSGNIKLLNTLMRPDNYFSAHQHQIDEIISTAYEELKLKNVPLSEQIEFFIVNKLVDLRFFSNITGQDPQINGNLIKAKERINLVLDSINDLKKECLNTQKVDERFLFVATFLTRNIHVLKQQLKSTYDRLPWEEIEFCLITFISSNTKKKYIHPFCQVVLNKIKILKHLENFAKKLKDQNYMEYVNIDNLGDLSNLKREKVVAGIIESYPEFEELYKDYQQIRDIQSLEKISSYIKLALLANPKEKMGS